MTRVRTAMFPRGIVLSLIALALGCRGGRAPDAAAGEQAELPVVTALSSPDEGETIDSARAVVRAAAQEGVGLAVAVFQAGEPVWIEGIGYADRETATKVDPERTRFRIYSVTKWMTAAAAARLMEQGRLDASAPIQTYVPSYPAHDPPITTMELATHTSGIRHYADEAEARSRRHCETVDEALPIFENDPLVHPPGSDEVYSSWGYVALSAVIAGAAGTSFVSAIDSLVFEPVGMTRMALDDPTRPVADRASFFEEKDGRLVTADPVDNTCKWGAGAFVATAPDVARFGSAMLDDRLLSGPSRELFFEGRDRVSVQGVGAGGLAILILDRSRGISVALLANAIGEDAGPAAQRAAERVADLFGR